MTEPIVCHEGSCENKYKSFLDKCLDCDLVKQIEHDLLKEMV